MKEKIKIMKTRPQVTEEEIKTYMDFNTLLVKASDAKGEQRNFRRTRNLFISVAILVTIPALLWFIPGKEEKAQQPDHDAQPLPPSLSPARPDTLKSEVVEPQDKQPQQTPRRKKDDSTGVKQNIAKKETAPATEQPVYVQAEPLQGYPSLYDYFDKNLVYPRDVKDPVEGVVDVTFVIDTKGKAVNITVDNSLGEAFDREVVRLIQNMPQWRPALYNAKPVQSKISLPITFSVKKKPNP
jgi:TonB family protein